MAWNWNWQKILILCLVVSKVSPRRGEQTYMCQESSSSPNPVEADRWRDPGGLFHGAAREVLRSATLSRVEFGWSVV